MSSNKKPDSNSDTTSWKEYPFLLIKGFLMGSADIVPGVSGGTMALIVGIYTRLINAIKSFDSAFIKQCFSLKFRSALEQVHWRFMVMLLSGIFGAVLFFTKVVPLQIYMFTNPELVFGLFFGLIVGSIFVLAKAIEGFNWLHAAMILVGTGIGFWVVTLVPADTPESPFFVFISGSIAICAMILPGISGSYLLLILRKYDFVLTQISKLGTPETASGIITLIPFLIGAVAGLALFSRLLSWLLDRYYGPTLAVLIGFLIGSLYVIWPYQNRSYEEVVTIQDEIAYNSSLAVDLRNNPPDENQPSFNRLGEIVEGGEGSNIPPKVELLKVRKKLIKSDPFVPFITTEDAGTDHFWSGIWGMVAGLIMVVGLDYLRTET